MFEHPKGVQRSISRPKAAAAVAALTGRSTEDAARFVEDEELHSGLLVARSEGLEFWHLTFQEYLCALAFSPLNDKRWSRLRPHLNDDRWIEVLLLLAGCERRHGLDEARELITRVLSTGVDAVSAARAVALASGMLRDIAPSGGDASADTDYLARLRSTLGIFEPAGEEVPENVRVEVGEALGRVDDPRLQDPEDNKVSIPGGSFWMGAQKKDRRGRRFDELANPDEAPVHKVTLSPFRIGRYPVTVREFANFLSAGFRGYLDPSHWNEAGWEWRRSSGRVAPGRWEEQMLSRNRPVVGVSWYEAAAYARWVGGRLPTESEWEWVACGASGRKYPWGNSEPTQLHANFGQRLAGPSPIAIYPADITEHGVRDLAGNVCEWCADRMGAYPDSHVTDPKGPDRGLFRVLRGGSFTFYAKHLRSSSRRSFRPEHEFDFIGFRVAWPAAGGQT